MYYGALIMKIIHRFKNYEREETVVALKRWRSKANKELAGLYEPSIQEEDAVISISEDLLGEGLDRELFSTALHECAHSYFNWASESRVREFESKVMTLIKKLGIEIKRTKDPKPV